LSINNYAVAGRWGIKDFVRLHPNEINKFPLISSVNNNQT
jgi:hypothetical protein